MERKEDQNKTNNNFEYMEELSKAYREAFAKRLIQRQTTLPEEAPVVGIPVSEVLLPPTITITAIVRDGTPLPADPDLTIEAEDQIILLCAREAEEDLDLVRSLFSAVDIDDEDEDE